MQGIWFWSSPCHVVSTQHPSQPQHPITSRTFELKSVPNQPSGGLQARPISVSWWWHQRQTSNMTGETTVAVWQNIQAAWVPEDPCSTHTATNGNPVLSNVMQTLPAHMLWPWQMAAHVDITVATFGLREKTSPYMMAVIWKRWSPNRM